MKKPVNSNMYTVSLEEIWSNFADYLTGARIPLALVICTEEVSQGTRDALEKTFEALGYGKGVCAFVTLLSTKSSFFDQKGSAPSQKSSAPTHESLSERGLPEKDLLSIIEGLDPLCLVVADEQATLKCSEAYHKEVCFLEPLSLLTRPAVAFRSLDSLIAENEGKQIAWKALKCLPRLGR